MSQLFLGVIYSSLNSHSAMQRQVSAKVAGFDGCLEWLLLKHAGNTLPAPKGSQSSKSLGKQTLCDPFAVYVHPLPLTGNMDGMVGSPACVSEWRHLSV